MVEVSEEVSSFSRHVVEGALSVRGEAVGVQRLDLVIENAIVVELKAVERFADLHFAQLLSYMKATRLPLGLLINFHVPHLRSGIRRLINTRPFP